MKIVTLIAAFLFLALTPLAHASAVDEFTDMIARVNAKASIDLGDFKAKVGVEFGHDAPKIDAVIKIAGSAGDAYLSFRLGQTLKRPPEEVADYFVKNKGKGWGVIAKELGIKPGSPEFHALKKGKYLGDDDAPKGGGNHEDKPSEKGAKPEQEKGGEHGKSGEKGGGKGKGK